MSIAARLDDLGKPFWIGSMVLAFIFFWPLGLAILGEELPESQLARASAWYLGINCCVSLIGPIISGKVMDLFGKPAMFAAALGALAAVILGWLVSRLGGDKNRQTEVSSAAAVADREAA